MDASERLRRLKERMREAGRPEGLAPLAQALARTGTRLIRESFDTSIDAYGAPFSPLKHGHRRPLAGLRFWFEVAATTYGFRVKSQPRREEVVTSHQHGAEIPARRGGGGELLFNPRTGRLLSAARAAKRKLVYVSRARHFTAASYTLPRRQVVPEEATGGVGARWGTAMNAVGRDWRDRHFEGI